MRQTQLTYNTYFVYSLLCLLSNMPLAFGNNFTSSSSTGVDSSQEADDDAGFWDNENFLKIIMGIIIPLVGGVLLLLIVSFFRGCWNRFRLKQQLNAEPFHANIARELRLSLYQTEQKTFELIDGISKSVEPNIRSLENKNDGSLSCYEQYSSHRRHGLSVESKKYVADLANSIDNIGRLRLQEPCCLFRPCGGRILKYSQLKEAKGDVIKFLCNTGQYREYKTTDDVELTVDEIGSDSSEVKEVFFTKRTSIKDIKDQSQEEEVESKHSVSDTKLQINRIGSESDLSEGKEERFTAFTSIRNIEGQQNGNKHQEKEGKSETNKHNRRRLRVVSAINESDSKRSDSMTNGRKNLGQSQEEIQQSPENGKKEGKLLEKVQENQTFKYSLNKREVSGNGRMLRFYKERRLHEDQHNSTIGELAARAKDNPRLNVECEVGGVEVQGNGLYVEDVDPQDFNDLTEQGREAFAAIVSPEIRKEKQSNEASHRRKEKEEKDSDKNPKQKTLRLGN